MVNVIEFVFGFIIDAISFSIPDLLFGLPRVKLQKKIAIKTKKLGLSAADLNKLANKLPYTIIEEKGGFEFFNCTYLDLKRLWHALKTKYDKLKAPKKSNEVNFLSAFIYVSPL